MAQVIVDGVFMGAQLKTSEFEGNKKTSLLVDIYQPDSEQNNKTVQLRSDDVALYQKLVNDYDMGSVIKAKVAVNAYKNQAYFKLLNVEV